MKLSTLNLIREVLADREIEARAAQNAADRALRDYDGTDEGTERILYATAAEACESWQNIHEALCAFDAADWHF